MDKHLLKRVAAVILTVLTLGVPTYADGTFPEYHFTQADYVTEQPAGTLKLYERQGTNLKSYLGGVAESTQEGGKISIVFADDGRTVWMRNIISTAQDCLVWTKGEIKGDTIVIPQGSVMWFYDFQSYYNAYVLCNIAQNTDPDAKPTESYKCIPGDIKFSYKNGVLKLLPNSSGIVAIGLQRYSTDSFIIEIGYNYLWLGYGDINSIYTPFTDTPTAAPAQPEKAEKYAFTYKTRPDGVTCGHVVDVTKENNKLYVRGMSQVFGTEYWANADISGISATFPAKQYLGVDTINFCEEFFLYLCSTQVYSEEDSWGMNFTDATKFDYNESTGAYSSAGSMVMNCGSKSPLIGDYWIDMRLAPYTEQVVKPAAPIVGKTFRYNELSQLSRVSVDIPCLDVDGNFIDPKNLWFRMYINGELYTFKPENGHYISLEEPMTNIPYSFTGEDMQQYAQGQWAIDFFGDKPQSIGVQTICSIGTQTMMSDIVTYRPDGSVESVDAAGLIVSEEYFNLMGIPVSQTYKGIVIKVTKYSDGTVKNTKEVRQ